MFTGMDCLHLFKLLLATIVLVSGFSRITATKYRFEEYEKPADAIDFGDGHAPSYLMDPSIIV